MPKKQYVEFKVNNKVVAILEVKECTALEFLEKKKEAEKNAAQLDGAIKIYKNDINKLKQEIKVLKGEED